MSVDERVPSSGLVTTSSVCPPTPFRCIHVIAEQALPLITSPMTDSTQLSTVCRFLLAILISLICYLSSVICYLLSAICHLFYGIEISHWGTFPLLSACIVLISTSTPQ